MLAYALLLVLATIYFGSGSQRGGGVWLPLLASLLVVFGMLRRGTRRLAAPRPEPVRLSDCQPH